MISAEYNFYRQSKIMKRLASYAHKGDYLGQTSSACLEEVLEMCQLAQYCDSILDAGCGNGAFSLPLSVELAADVTGLDICGESIRQASAMVQKNAAYSKCQFKIGDFACSKAIGPEYFNIILTIGSLYWGLDIPSLFQTWKGHLLPAGCIIGFLNMQYEHICFHLQSSLDNTRFVNFQDFQDTVQRLGMKLSLCYNRTDKYISWLCRWLDGMEYYRADLLEEFGENKMMKMQKRFETYLRLASTGVVKRMVFMVEVNNKC